MKEFKSFSVKKDINYIKDVNNLTNSALAKFLNISEATLFRWYNNPKNISYDTLNKIYDSAYSDNLKINVIKSHIYVEEYEKKGLQVIFHGSKKGILGDKIDLKYSNNENDFGVGFYCGESIIQPETFVLNYPQSSLYIFVFDYKKLKKVEFKVDNDWMLAIAYYRGYLKEYVNNKKIKRIIDKIDKADYIVAPIADNMMFDTIKRFTNGEISDVQCQHCLSATNLGKQIVLKSKKAIQSLKCIDRCFICEQERKDLIRINDDNRIISENKVNFAISKYRKEGLSIGELLNE